MSELPRPVSEVMRAPVGEASISRMWRGVSDRRAAARAQRRPAWAVAALAATAALVLVLWLAPRGAPTAAGPLRLAGGGEIGQLAVAAEAGASRPVALSDGSLLVLSPGATFSQLESTGLRFSALLGAGKVEIAVVPGGPRHWSIECGLATVEVVGTHFTLDRSVERDRGRLADSPLDRGRLADPPLDQAAGDAPLVEILRVAVTEGIVLVRGERVPDRVRRLTAGEALEIRAPGSIEAGSASRPSIETGSASRPSIEKTAPAPEASAPSPEPAPRGEPSAAPSGSARAPSATWRELAKRGEYADAYRSLGDRGIAQAAQSGGVDDLLALADVARLSGHAAEAVAPLRRVVDEHPGDSRAALAAFTLGRLQLDSLGQPATAAHSFAKALSLGIAGPLVEDAQARLVEAHARAGNRDAAKAAADQYERQFPSGRHVAAVRRWVAD